MPKADPINTPITADEFECESCGRLIISLPPRKPPPARCGLCLWLDEFVPDPKERAEILKRYA